VVRGRVARLLSLPHNRAEFAPPRYVGVPERGARGEVLGTGRPEPSIDSEDTDHDPANRAGQPTLSFKTPGDCQAGRRLRSRADPLIALLPTNCEPSGYAGTMLWFIRNKLRGS
jgi:hypothetical protein